MPTKTSVKTRTATARISAPRAQTARVESGEKNSAPSQWGRRLARIVGEKFHVAMAENQAKNEGRVRGRDIVIKCAKSQTPPVSVLNEMLDRLDALWAVFILPDGSAEVWQIAVEKVRANGYQTRGAKVQRRIELRYRKAVQFGTLVGTLSETEVASCNIP